MPTDDGESFDDFCERLKVTGEELPHAFAAYLGKSYGWDGRYSRVDKG